MSETDAPAEATGKRGKMQILIGVALAIVLGAGGFYAVHSGLLFGGSPSRSGGSATAVDTAFLPIESLTVTLHGAQQRQHLRFAATLEVDRAELGDITRLMPRIVDVLNSYLSALDTAELAAPGTLVRLRAQMLRRVRIITGDDRVRDLLITEFVLN